MSDENDLRCIDEDDYDEKQLALPQQKLQPLNCSHATMHLPPIFCVTLLP